MGDNPFQASIVGLDTMPTFRDQTRKSKYSFLINMRRKLLEGQAIRLLIPKGSPTQTPITYWYRLCGISKGHSQLQKNGDGSYILWLWVGEVKR